MNVSTLGGPQRIAPVMADIKNADKLYELAKDKSPQARADLGKAVAAILEKNVTVRECELVADVLIELLHQAEEDLRHALSEQLSLMENVPLRLILQLANDEIQIATPVLKRSDVLVDIDLIYIIKSKSAEYWRIIAQRSDLGDQAIDALSDTGDVETALNLAENLNITLTEHAMVVLSDMAQKESRLSMPLLRRDEISCDIASKLYQFVGKEVKRFILENYDVKTDQLMMTVDNTVNRFAVDIDNENGFSHEEQMIDEARSYKKKGLLNIKFILETLRRGHLRSFVAQFSIYTGIAPKIIEELIQQRHGRGLAILCRAKNIEKRDFVSLFMLTNRIRSNGETIELSEMKKAMGYYSRITTDIAQSVIATSKEKRSSLH